MSSFTPGLEFGELDELLIPHGLERVRPLCHDALTSISILFLNIAIKISKARYPLGGQSGSTPSPFFGRPPVSSKGAYLLGSDLQVSMCSKKNSGKERRRRRAYSNALAKTFFCPANYFKSGSMICCKLKTKTKTKHKQKLLTDW